MTAVINRPWLSSFHFEQSSYSATKLEQFHKLTRNFVASLDVGCPSVKHVGRPKFKSERDAYLSWVSDWKKIYKRLSEIIRFMKVYRRTIRFPKLSPAEIMVLEKFQDATNQSPEEYLRQLSRLHLERLQETAMVMLNARYNAKLASGARRARNKA